MSAHEPIDPQLRSYATPRQLEIIDAIERTKSKRKAAQELGITARRVFANIENLKAQAARRGWSPSHDMRHPVPAPFVVKGTSTLYKDGEAVLQWVKTREDARQVEEGVREFVESLLEGIPRAKPLPPPKKVVADLANLYTLTDCHVGMRAWAPETGADWDLDIAEHTLLAAFSHLVSASPDAGIGFVNQLGDFLHFDSLAPTTPTSGHILDADGRYSKVVSAACRILRRVVDLALLRHEKVVVLIAEGNHDIASSLWLRHLFGLLYENEPRVEVLAGERPFYAYQHGKTMLAFHHGHLVKNAQLPLVFAAQYPEMWGQTSRRYAHVGHWHHVEEKEHAGMKVIQHPTLAAADAYAARNGYLSNREITSITYHTRFGQVARNTVTPEMLG